LEYAGRNDLLEWNLLQKAVLAFREEQERHPRQAAARRWRIAFGGWSRPGVGDEFALPGQRPPVEDDQRHVFLERTVAVARRKDPGDLIPGEGKARALDVEIALLVVLVFLPTYAEVTGRAHSVRARLQWRCDVVVQVHRAR